MSIPKPVLLLIKEEQLKQNGKFVPEDPSYLEKLDKFAELVTHQKNGITLGYVFFYCNAKDKINSFITLIGIAAKAQGKGFGYALLQHALLVSRLRGFSNCQLEVRKDNLLAFEFYRRAGFKIAEDRIEKYLMTIATQ